MKKSFRIIWGALVVFFAMTNGSQAQSEKKLVLGEHELFKVSKADNEIRIDGKMSEPDWAKTDARSLDYFYRIERPTDQQKTTFRMLWDEKNLYVFFECEDQYLTARETKRDGLPYVDDCAEIFLIPAPDSLNIHLGFEVNLYKTSHDFIWLNDFFQGKIGCLKSYNPDFQVEVSMNGTVNDNSDIDKGWSMEMAIPLSLFNGVDTFFPAKPGTHWAFLAVRQDRNDLEGDRRSTSTIFPVYDISKGVHQPNRFGLMQFSE